MLHVVVQNLDKAPARDMRYESYLLFFYVAISIQILPVMTLRFLRPNP